MRRYVAVLAPLCAAFVLGACGEDKEEESSGGGGSNAGRVTAEEGLTDAATILNRVKEGTFTTPDETPRPAAENKTVVLVSSGQNNPSAALPVAGQAAACEAIGWECTILDAKSDPTAFGGLVRQAIAQKPDGIIVHAMDCAVITQPLKEAKAAGIPVIGEQAFDCDDPSIGGEKLFAAQPVYPDQLDSSKDANYAEYVQQFGAAKAASALAAVGDNANIIHICGHDVLILDYICAGETATLEKAAGIEVTEVETRLADLGPKLESQVSSALLEAPDATAIISPHGAASLIIASAVKKAGKSGKIWVQGSEGAPAELDQVKAGSINSVIAGNTSWVGWSAIDTLNSVFTDKPVFQNGFGFLYVDKNNVPADTSKGMQSDEIPDFEAVYKKAWGV